MSLKLKQTEMKIIKRNYEFTFYGGGKSIEIINASIVTAMSRDNSYRRYSGAVVSHNSIKVATMISIVDSFSKLHENWDGYGADRINLSAQKSAINIIHQFAKNDVFNNINMHIFPMRDGGIQVELDGSIITAELEIDQNGTVKFIQYNEEGDIVDERIFSEFDVNSICEILEDLVYA